MRKPEIVADAAHAILVRDARTTTGRFFIDEEALREAGVTDFSQLRGQPGRAAPARSLPVTVAAQELVAVLTTLIDARNR